jgi:hypothetical protein
MKTKKTLLASTAFCMILLAACQDGGPTGLNPDELTLEDQLTLELLSDPATAEVALELVGIQASAAQRKGWAWGSEHNQTAQAQAERCFREAQDALAQGNLLRARNKAREGRRLVAQGIALAGGSRAIVGMVERLEALPLTVSADPDAFVNPGKLGLQIGKLATRARAALKAGDHTEAGSLGVLGEQAFRHNHRRQYMHQQELGITRAELAIALGAEAIELASRLLTAQPAVDAQSQDLLSTAEEFLAKAEEALEAGEEARAAHLARLAQWWALKAVILPGGITDEEARSMFDLAETLLAEATAYIASLPEPTPLQVALLTRATRMFERGREALGNGVCRGIGALWQSAVISSYLIG